MNVSVGSSTAVQIVGANPKRISLIIVNNHSSADLYIDTVSTLTTTTAGVIISAGGNLTEDSGGDRMWLGPWYGLAGENLIDVRYLERER